MRANPAQEDALDLAASLKRPMFLCAAAMQVLRSVKDSVSGEAHTSNFLLRYFVAS